MKDSASRKKKFLGMPHGTAAARLRKMVMFRLLEKHNENFCFKCKERITTPDELSIEHIEPWEGVSIELFWSLNNIAFSHLRCNRPHRYVGGGIGKRKVGPDGTAWCVRCKGFRPISEFSRNRTRWNGLQKQCNDCIKGVSRV